MKVKNESDTLKKNQHSVKGKLMKCVKLAIFENLMAFQINSLFIFPRNVT